MNKELINHIMDRTVLNPICFSLERILKVHGMGIYERICSERILEEHGVDNKDIIPDFLNMHLLLTGEGIRKCKSILLSYLNVDQMAEILHIVELEEESVCQSNNLLWMLRQRSISELKELLKEEEGYKEEDNQSVHQYILAELKSRTIWNKIRLVMRKYLQEMVIHIKYRSIFRGFKFAIQEFKDQKEFAKVPRVKPEDKPEIVKAVYERLRDIPQKKRTKDEFLKYVYYGVIVFEMGKKDYIHGMRSCYQIEADYKAMHDILQKAAELTPRDFLNLFPVDKEYYGKRYGQKDYFYTMEMLRHFPMDKPIGDNIDAFFDMYNNRHILNFFVNYFCCIDDYAVYCKIDEPLKQHFTKLKKFYTQEGRV